MSKLNIITVKKLEDRLVPEDEESFKLFNSLKVGEAISFDYKEKKQRNYQFHKKLFSMLNLIKLNQNRYKSVDNILTECKFRAGYFDIHITQKGEQIYIPKSISFATMKPDDFEKFYSSCIDTCLTLVPMGKNELENAVLNYC